MQLRRLLPQFTHLAEHQPVLPLECGESWAFDHQFFCGVDLLVVPCLDPSGRVRVYLPEGEWRRFPGGEAFTGGRKHDLVLALDELAVFARRGAEIPLGPAARHTGELGAAPVVASVWYAT